MTRARLPIVLVLLLGALPALGAPAGAAPGWHPSGAVEAFGDAQGVSVRRDAVAEVLFATRDLRAVDPSTPNLSFRPAGGEWAFAGASGMPRELVDAGARVIGNGTGDLAAWAHADGAERRLLVAVRRAGEWSAVQEVATGATAGTAGSGPSVIEPVAFNAEGEVLLSWLEASVVRARIRTAGGRLGPAVTLSAPGVSAAPAALLNDAGDAVVVWTRRGRVEGGHRRSGGSWLGRREINALGGRVVGEPSVAQDASGNAVAVWQTRVAGSAVRRVWVADHPAGTAGWGRREQLLQAPAVRDADVAMDGEGNALVAVGILGEPVRVADRRVGGRFGRARAVPGVTGLVGVGVSPLGDAVLVAASATEAGDRFRVARRPAGAARWTVAPDAVGADLSGRPRLAVGPAGDAALTWTGRPSASASPVYGAAYETHRPPRLRGLEAVVFSDQAGRLRLRIALAGPGRVLVRIRPMFSRRVVAAFTAAVGGRAGSVELPERVVRVLRPGAYDLIGDSGSHVLRRAFLRVEP